MKDIKEMSLYELVKEGLVEVDDDGNVIMFPYEFFTPKIIVDTDSDYYMEEEFDL